MSVLLDQRDLTGQQRLETREAIRAYWEKRARDVGFPMRRYQNGDTSRDLRRSDEELTAYVNDSRWVADCRECKGGIAAGPDFDEGICFGCGTIYPLRHPPAEELELAEAALAVRPWMNRHWRPSIESVDVLRAENEAHGYLSDAEAAQGEIEQVAAATGLKPATVERIIRAQEALGNR